MKFGNHKNENFYTLKNSDQQMKEAMIKKMKSNCYLTPNSLGQGLTVIGIPRACMRCLPHFLHSRKVIKGS